jgi:hypothetical protein
MNRAVDTTAADKRRVRGRDDNVDVSSGDVAPDDLDLHEPKAARTLACLINWTIFSLPEDPTATTIRITTTRTNTT